MKMNVFQKTGKKYLVALLALVLFTGASSYVFAGSDSTRNASGSSYTRWVGPAVSSKYAFDINGDSYSGTKKNAIEYKDPYRIRTGYSVYLSHGQNFTGTYYNGSSTAYHRGYVQNGYVKVTA